MRQAANYRPGESFLHRANPLTKLAALGFSIAMTAPLGIAGLWGAVGLLMATGFAIGIGRFATIRFLVLVAPFLIAVVLFHAFILSRPDMVDIGLPLNYSAEGLRHALTLSGRVSLILSAAILFVATTHPAEMLRSFDAAGCPPAVSYLLASPLLMLEQFALRAKAISDAQQARGLDISGGIRARFRGLLMLLMPLVTEALSDANERALLLNGRGFRALPRRTVLRAPADSPFQRALRRALLAASLLAFGAALWL